MQTLENLYLGMFLLRHVFHPFLFKPPQNANSYNFILFLLYSRV